MKYNGIILLFSAIAFGSGMKGQVSKYNHPSVILGQKEIVCSFTEPMHITPDLIFIQDLDGNENTKYRLTAESGNGYKIEKGNQIVITDTTLTLVTIPVSVNDGFCISNTYETIIRNENRSVKHTLYVSPNGKDCNTGSISSPLKTLEGARCRIRLLKEKQGLPVGGITVLFREGEYFMNRTALFGTDDSGEADKPIIYAAFPNEKVRFTGAKTLHYSWFTPAAKTITNKIIDVSARKHIKALDLKRHDLLKTGEIEQVGYVVKNHPIPTTNIFIDGKRMHIARYPNDANFDDIESPQGRNMFVSKGKRVTQWENTGDIWIDGAVSKAWEWMKNKIDNIGKDGKVMMAYDYHSDISIDHPKMFYFNILEELDAPGEWFIDKVHKKLYAYLPDSVNEESEIRMNQSDQVMIRFKGTRYITLQGINIDGTRSTAVEIIDKASHITLKECSISCCGLDGVTVNGMYNRIIRCDINNVGAHGISLSGGDETSLTPACNLIESCKIHDFSQERKVYNPGVSMQGVGQVMRNTELFNGPHMALNINGNNHLVEFSDFHDAPKEYSDMLAVYMNTGGSPLQRGTVIRHNHFHDVQGTWKQSAGIYLDNETSGVLVEHNYFYNNNAKESGWSVMVHGGADNVVRDNVFANCNFPFSISTRLNGYASKEFEGLLHKWEKALKEAPAIYYSFYPELSRYFDDEGVYPQVMDYKYHLVKDADGKILNYWDRRTPSSNVFKDNVVYHDDAHPYCIPPTDTRKNLENHVFFSTGNFRIKDGVRQDNLIHSGNIEILPKKEE